MGEFKNELTHIHPDRIELCLVEERIEGYPNEQKRLTIPFRGELPKCSEHKGNLKNISHYTFLDTLGLPYICIEYEFEGAPLGSGITNRAYLFWVTERNGVNG